MNENNTLMDQKHYCHKYDVNIDYHEYAVAMRSVDGSQQQRRLGGEGREAWENITF